MTTSSQGSLQPPPNNLDNLLPRTLLITNQPHVAALAPWRPHSYFSSHRQLNSCRGLGSLFEVRLIISKRRIIFCTQGTPSLFVSNIARRGIKQYFIHYEKNSVITSPRDLLKLGDVQSRRHPCPLRALSHTRCFRLLCRPEQARQRQNRVLWNTFLQRIPECLCRDWYAWKRICSWHPRGQNGSTPQNDVLSEKVPAELIKNGDTFDIMRLDGLDPMIGNIEAFNYFLSSNEDYLKMA